MVDPVPDGELDDLDKVMVRPNRPAALGGQGPDATELGVPEVAGARVPAKTSKRPKSARPSASTGAKFRRRRRWPWIAALAVVVAALIGGGVALAAQSGLFTPSHPVPALTGKTVPQAVQAVKKDKFSVRTTGHAASITIGPGLIVSQRPAPRSAGRPTTAKEGSAIGVVVSTGPPPVAIPPLTSFTSCADAVAALKTVHLVGVCPAAAQQYSSTVVAGAVLGSVPSGTAPYGSTVTISTSKGHAPEAIPAVTGSGSSYASAAAALSAAGFVPSQNNEFSSTVPTGQVIGTSPDPGAGPQPFGSRVSVAISLGPQPVIIPSVDGQSVAAATSALTALGLKVSGPYGPPGATKVLSTDPVAGVSVQPGTTVNLYTL